MSRWGRFSWPLWEKVQIFFFLVLRTSKLWLLQGHPVATSSGHIPPPCAATKECPTCSAGLGIPAPGGASLLSKPSLPSPALPGAEPSAGQLLMKCVDSEKSWEDLKVPGL